VVGHFVTVGGSLCGSLWVTKPVTHKDPQSDPLWVTLETMEGHVVGHFVTVGGSLCGSPSHWMVTCDPVGHQGDSRSL
jgi:hypothetical protein